MKRFIGIIGALVLVGVVVVPTSALASSSTSWKVYNYNSSGHALAPQAPTSITGDSATFNFAANTYAALLVTSEKSATGDLTGKTLGETITVTGVGGSFVDQNDGGCTPDNQSVRLFFESPGNAFTNFWWSNPASVQLSGNTATITISAALADPSAWSDFDGQAGNSSPSVTAGFMAAVAKVSSVGLSFGGGCFFENGVTTSDGSGTFAGALTISS
jgi:hypothetical protein